MRKIVAGIAILAIVSLISYHLGHKAGLSEVDQVLAEQKVKADLVELTRKDFEEYQSLKTLEDRYKKADEILGKVVTLFLADVGLRLGYKAVPPQSLANNCPAVPAPVPCPVAPPLQVVPAPTPKPTPQKQNVAWMREELRLLNETNDRDALRDLKKMEIADLLSAVQSAQPISNLDAPGIDGKFAGEINFSDRKEHKNDWLIEWEVHLRAGAKPTGPMSITLTDKGTGKVFSNTKGNTPGKDFMKIPGSRGLLVNVYGDDGYIQIYPFENRSIWLGNYYEKVKLGTYKLSGQVRLNRLN